MSLKMYKGCIEFLSKAYFKHSEPKNTLQFDRRVSNRAGNTSSHEEFTPTLLVRTDTPKYWDTQEKFTVAYVDLDKYESHHQHSHIFDLIKLIIVRLEKQGNSKPTGNKLN